VLLNVRTAFFAARARKDLVRVAEETLANQQAHLRQTEGFVTVGTRPQIDLARPARPGQRRGLRIGAVAAYQTPAQLNQAMGIEATTEFEVADDQLPPVDGEDRSIEALFEEALRARPEVASREADLRAQEAAVSAARGGWFPSLGVHAGMTDVGAGLRGPDATWNWNAGATLSWTLFQGGMTGALVREAEAGWRPPGPAGHAAAPGPARSRAGPLRGQLGAGQAGGHRGGPHQRRERLRLAEGRYNAGSGSALELSDAQLQVTLPRPSRCRRSTTSLGARPAAGGAGRP